MSQRLVKPASSAARATAASSAAVAAGCPGQSKRETCRPKRSVIGSSCWRAPPAARRGRRAGRAPRARRRGRRRTPRRRARRRPPGPASRTWPRDDLRRDRARALAVAPAHDGGGRVEHDRVRGHPVRSATARHASRRPRSRPVESMTVVSRAPQPLVDDEVEDVEGVLARADVALAGADDGAQAVGRDDLVGVEPVGRPVRLARRRRPDEDDEARVRQAQRRPVERRLGHPAFSGPRPDRAPLDRALLAWP